MALSNADIILAVRTDVNDTVQPYKTSDVQMAYWIKTAVRTIVGMAPNASLDGSSYPTSSDGVSDGMEGAIVEYMLASHATRQGDAARAGAHMQMFKALVDGFLKNP